MTVGVWGNGGADCAFDSGPVEEGDGSNKRPMLEQLRDRLLFQSNSEGEEERWLEGSYCRLCRCYVLRS